MLRPNPMASTAPTAAAAPMGRRETVAGLRRVSAGEDLSGRRGPQPVILGRKLDLQRW